MLNHTALRSALGLQSQMPNVLHTGGTMMHTHPAGIGTGGLVGDARHALHPPAGGLGLEGTGRGDTSMPMHGMYDQSPNFGRGDSDVPLAPPAENAHPSLIAGLAAKYLASAQASARGL